MPTSQPDHPLPTENAADAAYMPEGSAPCTEEEMRTIKHQSTSAAIALILSPIDIDCADVLATTSAESAAALLFAGWDLSAPYEIAVCFGDREAAEAILGRRLTRRETSALEACIRAHLAAG